MLSCSGRFNILSHEIDCCAPILLAFTAPVASAAEFPQRPFEHKDREVACDNTRTCRAAGYASDKADNKASILLTRKAGPSQPVRTQLRLGETAPALPSTVQTHIDGHALGEVKIGNDAIGDLTAAQTASLLGALSTRAQLKWDAKGKSWTISAEGANAVLLKMDEFQGRIGTPGALVRKGTRPEATVLPPLPAPEITAGLVVSA